MRKGKKSKPFDPCPVCDENLYYNSDYTKRIGILDDVSSVYAWMCPYCRATFDKKDKLSYISGVNSIQGKT